MRRSRSGPDWFDDVQTGMFFSLDTRGLKGHFVPAITSPPVNRLGGRLCRVAEMKPELNAKTWDFTCGKTLDGQVDERARYLAAECCVRPHTVNRQIGCIETAVGGDGLGMVCIDNGLAHGLLIFAKSTPIDAKVAVIAEIGGEPNDVLAFELTTSRDASDSSSVRSEHSVMSCWLQQSVNIMAILAIYCQNNGSMNYFKDKYYGFKYYYWANIITLCLEGSRL